MFEIFTREAWRGAGAALGLVVLAGCTVDFSPPGPEKTETRTIELDKTEVVRADIDMGVGRMHVKGGSANLLDAEFRYNRPAWRPEVRYEASGSRGHLRVEQPGSHGGSGRGGHYSWDLRFNDDKPLDLSLHFGVGEARLDLGSLYLRSLEVHMGVGSARLDLRGTPRTDCRVNLRGGVGEATIYLPHEAGIMAEAHGGIGGIKTSGLRKREDGTYVNDAYGRAKTTIRLDVSGGVGAINLIG